MYKSLIANIVDPFNAQKLSLTVFEETGERVVEGYLANEDGDIYPIINSVPCFLKGDLEPDFGDFYQRHELELITSHKQERQKEQSKTDENRSDSPERSNITNGVYLE